MGDAVSSTAAPAPTGAEGSAESAEDAAAEGYVTSTLTSLLNSFGQSVADPLSTNHHALGSQNGNALLMGLTARWANESLGATRSAEQFQAAASCLAELKRTHGVEELVQVEIYRDVEGSLSSSSSSTSRAVQRVLVYWFGSEQEGGDSAAALQLEWGPDGLRHRLQKGVPPTLRAAQSKECGLSPMTVAAQLLQLRGREYSPVDFDSQHFCSLLFSEASGNHRLNAELDRLERAGTTVSSADVYCELRTPSPSLVGAFARGSGGLGHSAATSERWTLVLWWHEAVREEERQQPRGLCLRWSPEGLTFQCTRATPPGAVVYSREVGSGFGDVRWQLRKVEGQRYQTSIWDDRCFALWLFEQCLCKGNFTTLREHLEELQRKDLHFASCSIIAVDALGEANTAGSTVGTDRAGSGTCHHAKALPDAAAATAPAPPAAPEHNGAEAAGEGQRAEARPLSSLCAATPSGQQLGAPSELASSQQDDSLGSARQRQVLPSRSAWQGAPIKPAAPQQHGSADALKQHALVYSYRIHDHSLVYLRLDFVPFDCSIRFVESREDPAPATLLYTKPMLFARLPPRELKRQLLEVQQVLDIANWDSLKFCWHLFDQSPGTTVAHRSTSGSGRPRVSQEVGLRNPAAERCWPERVEGKQVPAKARPVERGSRAKVASRSRQRLPLMQLQSSLTAQLLNINGGDSSSGDDGDEEGIASHSTCSRTPTGLPLSCSSSVGGGTTSPAMSPRGSSPISCSQLCDGMGPPL